MKRIGIWLFYGVGAIAIAYLALYAYALWTRPDLTPGDPIRIFRKPDAPNYSQVPSFLVWSFGPSRKGEGPRSG